MKRIVLLALPLLANLGCAACDDSFLLGLGISFSHPIEDEVQISFGDVGQNCDAHGERSNDRGTVTYDHAATNGGDCALSSTWVGTLLDIESTKADAAVEMQRMGVDPATAKVTFSKVSFAVGAVTFRDKDGNDITPPTIPSYRGSIDVDQTPEVIVVEHEGDGDPTQPEIIVGDTQPMVDALNDAWTNDVDIPGSGVVTAIVDASAADALAEEDEPSLEIEYVVTVEGAVGL